MSQERVAGLQAWGAGERGQPVLLVTGPPVGAAIFREVQRRLAPRRSLALELLTDEPAGIRDLAARLDAAVREIDAAAVAAHGLAVPVAMRLETEALVVISNGPIQALDPVTAGLAAIPGRALASLLRPALFRRWLSSSAGLRRAVVNPYVMDRDTVAMLSEVSLGSAARRRATAAWIADLPRALSEPAPRPRRLAAIWGDADFIYPIQQLEFLGDGQQIESIPGARLLHPEERPWALADALAGALEAAPEARPDGTVT